MYSVIVYLVAIYAGTQWMKHRSAYDLKRPLFLWNAALAVFSIMGTIRTGTELFHVLSTNGFHGSICYPSSDNVTSLWRFAFVMSKFAEVSCTCLSVSSEVTVLLELFFFFMQLWDTFFIVARKKPLMFLHWYVNIACFVCVT
jgi:elongation of very long chain fatty acids protein 6